MTLETQIQICCLQRLIAERTRRHKRRSHLVRQLQLLIAADIAEAA